MADKILTAWFFFALIHLALIGWFVSGRIHETPALIKWQLPFPFLHGPFLYLYIMFLSGQQRYRERYLLHFIPAVLVAILLAFVPLDAIPKNATDPILPPLKRFFQAANLSIMISGVVYVTRSLVLLHRHKRNIGSQFSNTDKITLNWMRYLISGMGVIWGIVIFVPSPLALYIAVALFIFFIGYFGIRQVGVFTNPLSTHEVFLPAVLETDGEPVETEIREAVNKVKYQKTKLEETEVIRIHTELTTLMTQQQCYKDAELTLGDLSNMLNIHPGVLSQVINSKEEKNFYDYVNTLRVEAFKQLLSHPDSKKYTLLTLAFACGFNSKTSFNRNFKKFTAMSPSSYVKMHKIETQPDS